MNANETTQMNQNEKTLMNTNEKTLMTKTVNRALKISSTVKGIKAKLKPLEEELGGLKVKIHRDLDEFNLEAFSTPKGVVKIQTRKGAAYLDREALMKDLGVENLEKYKLRKDDSVFPVLTSVE